MKAIYERLHEDSSKVTAIKPSYAEKNIDIQRNVKASVVSVNTRKNNFGKKSNKSFNKSREDDESLSI